MALVILDIWRYAFRYIQVGIKIALSIFIDLFFKCLVGNNYYSEHLILHLFESFNFFFSIGTGGSSDVPDSMVAQSPATPSPKP